jgi:N-acetylglucosamine-6-sulfatase
MLMKLASAILLASVSSAAAASNKTNTTETTAANRPNIVFIFTDDQDLHMGSLDTMSVLQKELVSKGTQFNNHWATVALCCPSRASLHRGQAAHNTNITAVHGPGYVIPTSIT